MLEQRIARIYRIGQKRNIQVINLVASHTIEEDMLTKLNFKSSLFEGILDNGEDSIFLDDSKLDKMMSTIEIVTATDETAIDEPLNIVGKDDGEEATEQALEQPLERIVGTDDLSDSTDDSTSLAESPQQLLQQGLSFFAGLARTLSSPEATEKLVNSIVETDKETGQTSLRIPVANKESVSDILQLMGKLFAGNKNWKRETMMNLIDHAIKDLYFSRWLFRIKKVSIFVVAKPYRRCLL